MYEYHVYFGTMNSLSLGDPRDPISSSLDLAYIF